MKKIFLSLFLIVNITYANIENQKQNSSFTEVIKPAKQKDIQGIWEKIKINKTINKFELFKKNTYILINKQQFKFVVMKKNKNTKNEIEKFVKINKNKIIPAELLPIKNKKGIYEMKSKTKTYIWTIKKVSKDFINDKLNLKKGDLLLGLMASQPLKIMYTLQLRKIK